MKLKNGAEYIDSLRCLKPVIYYKGKRIKDVTRHSATASHVRAAAMTYALAGKEKYKDMATTTSHLTGRTIRGVGAKGPWLQHRCYRQGQSV